MKAADIAQHAREEWKDSGFDSCFGGEVTHDKIMTMDMAEALQELGNAVIEDSLCYKDILAFKRAYNDALNERIEEYAGDCEFEFEMAKRGL